MTDEATPTLAGIQEAIRQAKALPQPEHTDLVCSQSLWPAIRAELSPADRVDAADRIDARFGMPVYIVRDQWEAKVVCDRLRDCGRRPLVMMEK